MAAHASSPYRRQGWLRPAALSCVVLGIIGTVRAASAEDPPALPGPIVSLPDGWNGTGFSIDWSVPVAAAAFPRASKLWLVFGAQTTGALALPPQVTAAHPGLQARPHPRLTVLQLDAPATNVVLERVATAWVLHAGNAGVPQHPVEPWPPRDGEIKVENAAGIDELVDPIVGDKLGVVLMLDAEGAQPRLRRTPLVEVLPSLQGVVWRARADDVAAVLDGEVASLGPSRPQPASLPSTAMHPAAPPVPETSPNTVVEAKSAGDDPPAQGTAQEGRPPLAEPSPPDDQPAAAALAAPEQWDLLERTGAPAATGSKPLDLARWNVPNGQRQRERQLRLQRDLASARGAETLDARLDLARFLLAQGLSQEAEVTLAPLRDGADRRIGALRAVAALLANREPTAQDLSPVEFDSDPEIAWWRAAAAARRHDARAAVSGFDAAPPADPRYPPRLRLALVQAEAQSRIAAGQPSRALAAIARLRADRLSHLERARLKLLEGQALAASGDDPRADRVRAEAEASGDPSTQALARWVRTMAAVRAGTTGPVEAAHRLESDRPTWRDQPAEAAWMADLGRLQIQAGDPVAGLASLREATMLSGDPVERGALESEIRRQVTRALVGDGTTPPVAPAESLLIYRRYPEGLPTGEALADLDRHLAARLASDGLDEPAMALLEHGDRLGGTASARAEAGLAIAAGRLAEQRPVDALAALQRSGPEKDLDPDLSLSRRLVADQAQSAASETSSAPVVVPGPPSSARVAMYSAWQRRNWPDLEATASALLQATAPDQAPVDAVAGLALAQARQGTFDGRALQARLEGAGAADDETHGLLGMLQSPVGNATIDADALDADRGWLRSVRDYLKPLAAEPVS